jgi:hypothetical protein
MGDSMFRTVKNATASIALIGLALSQPAMAVRSADSLPAAGASVSHTDSRVGTPLGRVDGVAGHPAYGYVIAALIAAAVLAIVISDHHENKSPG